MKLVELKPGALGRITSLAYVQTLTRKKLLAIGILPGTEVQFVRMAPMGDPVQIRVRGCDIALRVSLAQQIEIESIEAQNVDNKGGVK